MTLCHWIIRVTWLLSRFQQKYALALASSNNQPQILILLVTNLLILIHRKNTGICLRNEENDMYRTTKMFGNLMSRDFTIRPFFTHVMSSLHQGQIRLDVGANIIQTDIPAKNGLLFHIDKVLLPMERDEILPRICGYLNTTELEQVNVRIQLKLNRCCKC